MKFKFFVAAAAALMSAACSEKIEECPVQSGEKVDLEIKLSGVATRTTDVSGEKTVNNLQVFVFGSSNKLEAYENTSDAESLTIGVLTGTKTIHVLVNAPKLSGIVNYEDLYKTSSSLTANNVSGFVMEGWKTLDVTSVNKSVTVDVKRLVSKVSLVKVENRLDEMYSGMEFKVKSAYLINVAGDRTYQTEQHLAAAPTAWYNKMAYSSGDGLEGLTYASYDVVVPHSESNTTQQNFYCYPNPTNPDTSAKPWSPRHTRLVVEITLGGTLYYYPLTMPVMAQNTRYQVSLAVTRPGSDDPDLPYNPEDAVVSIKVLDWVDGGTVNEII